MKRHYIIAGVAIVAFVALGASSFLSSMTPYIEDFDEVRKTHKSTIQVPGYLVKNKTASDIRAESFFFLRDKAGRELKVNYRGSYPANFGQAERVVAVGTYKNGALQAEKILVKCPSKYQNR